MYRIGIEGIITFIIFLLVCNSNAQVLHKEHEASRMEGLYGLSLKTEEVAEAEVILHAIDPPARPVPTTKEEMIRFRKQLLHRSSKFPYEASGFLAWQSAYRDSLSNSLMGGGFPERIPGDMQMEYEEEYPNFHLFAFSYQSCPDRRNTALLSIPRHVENAPVLVALHGHETTWAIADSAAYREGHVDDFCAYFANRGSAVLQPATMDHHLQDASWTLQGEWTWDAMNLLALDPRVKTGVVACILSTWNHYEKRFRIPLQCDWAALAAPKPVQFQHGLQDASFCPGADASLLDLKWNTGILPGEEYETMFAEITRAYGLYEKESLAITHIHKGPHSVDNEKAFDWIMNHLCRQEQ